MLLRTSKAPKIQAFFIDANMETYKEVIINFLKKFIFIKLSKVYIYFIIIIFIGIKNFSILFYFSQKNN